MSSTPVEQTSKGKHSSNVAITQLGDKSIARSTFPIMRPFPNRYGQGKVLQIKDHIVAITDSTEEEGDSEEVDYELSLDASLEGNPSVDDLEAYEGPLVNEEDLRLEANDIVDDDLNRVATQDGQEFKNMGDGDAQAHDNSLVDPPSRNIVIDGIISNAASVSNSPLPLVNDEPQQRRADKSIEVETMTYLDDTASFYGYVVPSHLVKPLHSLAAIDKEFWVGSSFSGTDLANAMMKMLGEAMLLTERPWNSLSKPELERLVQCVEGARLLQFKVDSLWPIATKAKRWLNYHEAKTRYDGLMVKIQELHQEAEAAKAEMEAMLEDGDLESGVCLDRQG